MRLSSLSVLLGLAVAVFGTPTVSAQPAVTDQISPGGIPYRHAHLPRARSLAIQFGWHDGYSLSLSEGQAAGSWAAGLIMRGPEGTSASEFSEDAKDAQARMSLSSNLRNTFGAVWAPPEKMDEAVALFGRTLATPALDPSILDQALKNRKAAIRQARTKAESLSGDVVSYLFFAPGPVRQWRLGDEAMLDAVTVPRIQEWRKAVLTRENLKVATAGPEGPETAGILVDKLLGTLPEKGAGSRKVAIPVTSSAKTVHLVADVPQTLLKIGGWSDFARQEDGLIEVFAMNILRERLFKAVREQLGAAYGATASLSLLGPDERFFSITAPVEHDKAATALAVMRAEYARFIAEGVTPEELEPQKAKWLSERREGMRRAPNVARLLRNAMLEDRSADYVLAYESRVTGLTFEKVNGEIRTKLAGKPVATIIVGPERSDIRADCTVKSAKEAENCGR